MNSMTGYGKFIVAESDRQITVEIKSVNNRYLDINCRIPKALSAVEDTVKRTIKKYLRRGSVDVFFNYENNSPQGKKRLQRNRPYAHSGSHKNRQRGGRRTAS